MTMPEKLEILIRRKGISKTDLASLAGITYRALANYLSGGRNPRKSILEKLAELLDTTPEFLQDQNRSLILSSEERFTCNAESPEAAIDAALSLLDHCKRIFRNCADENALSVRDKQALFSCMSEIYFSQKENNSEVKSDAT
ncbi:MAG: helix-turn-helix domain-containing protein [Oscillospiraceae bacterium]|nr:helix-turn-helix domain-containing protein [Oscillospiraceae bacterium]